MQIETAKYRCLGVFFFPQILLTHNLCAILTTHIELHWNEMLACFAVQTLREIATRSICPWNDMN